MSGIDLVSLQLLRRHRRIAAEGNPDEDDGLSPAEVCV
jgi:hypothetical protein